MLTYQDLLEVGESERDRMAFCLKLISEHQTSKAYREAVAAAKYYDGENPTIMRYEKLIYDQAGRAHVDMWSANHKIASAFFPFVVDQQVSYLLGNGVSFGGDETKDRLGRSFDQNMMDAAEYALVAGTSFGFYDLDHVVVFKLTEFAPLYDEEDGTLKAGVRWWQLDESKPLRFTLYEPDGFTEYVRRKGEEPVVRDEKRAYILRAVGDGKDVRDGTLNYEGENYKSFPIVPLYANKKHASVMSGKRNTVDALDLVTSRMINNVDEGNLIYWVLKNVGGMDDLDDAEFLAHLKATHVAHADGDADTSAEPHSIEAPFEGTENAIKNIEARLYRDFQAFDPSSVTASNQTATAIKAAYTPLDLKTDKFEAQMTRFIHGLLELAGIEDEPTYQRNQIQNNEDLIQSLVQAAAYLPEDYITEKLLTIFGDIDRVDGVLKQMAADDYRRIEIPEAE